MVAHRNQLKALLVLVLLQLPCSVAAPLLLHLCHAATPSRHWRCLCPDADCKMFPSFLSALRVGTWLHLHVKQADKFRHANAINFCEPDQLQLQQQQQQQQRRHQLSTKTQQQQKQHRTRQQLRQRRRLKSKISHIFASNLHANVAAGGGADGAAEGGT